jgi:hypothetical protein
VKELPAPINAIAKKSTDTTIEGVEHRPRARRKASTDPVLG